MISRILDLSVHQRWLVLLLSLLAARLRRLRLTKLPIDAVPDITNNQVQINTVAPSLIANRHREAGHLPGRDRARPGSRASNTPGPYREMALAGHRVFARSSTSTSPASRSPSACPRSSRTCRPRRRAPHGPRSRRASSESNMWSIHYAKPDERGGVACGQAGLATGRQLPDPEGQRLRTELERAAYLRTVQDWIIRPDQDRAGRGRRRRIGGFEKQYHVQPDPTKLTRPDLSFSDVARPWRPTTPTRAPATWRTTARATSCARPGAWRAWGRSRTSSSPPAAACRCDKDIAEVRIGRAPAHGLGQRGRAGVSSSAPR